MKEDTRDKDYVLPPEEPNITVESGLKYAIVDIMELVKLFHYCIYCSVLSTSIRVRTEVMES